MKPLRIAILAQLASPTISEFLAPALRERGHTVDVLDLSHVPEDGFAEHPDIQALTTYDLLYYRSGLDQDAYVTKLLLLEAALRESTVETVNLNFTTHPQAHAKSYEMQVATAARLPTPKTVYDSDASFENLQMELGTPFVSKTDFGTSGTGVYLIRTADELAAARKLETHRSMVHQEFIEHEFEYRTYFIGRELAFINKKSPVAGDFRSNEILGGEILAPEPKHTDELTRLGKLADQAFSFEIFVADFMLRKDTGEFIFTEITLNPGWKLANLNATGIDAIALTADYFERRCS